jgi:hypothetical protein
VNYGERADLLRLVKKLGMPDTFIHLGWGAMENPKKKTRTRIRPPKIKAEVFIFLY